MKNIVIVSFMVLVIIVVIFTLWLRKGDYKTVAYREQKFEFKIEVYSPPLKLFQRKPIAGQKYHWSLWLEVLDKADVKRTNSFEEWKSYHAKSFLLLTSLTPEKYNQIKSEYLVTSLDTIWVHYVIWTKSETGHYGFISYSRAIDVEGLQMGEDILLQVLEEENGIFKKGDLSLKNELYKFPLFHRNQMQAILKSGRVILKNNQFVPE